MSSQRQQPATSPTPNSKTRWWLLAVFAAVVGVIVLQVVRGPASGPSTPDGPRTPSSADRAENLLVITFDTLRFDALGFNGNSSVSTPNLDLLAQTGRVFTHAQAHNSVTLPSHTNIFTGLYPYQHGVRENAGFTVPTSVPTLATLLNDAGFATGAVVASFPLDPRFGLNRGFDFYDDRYPEATGNVFRVAQRPGNEVVPPAVRWWNENADQRRFLWVHLFDPHAPYDPPEPFAGKDPYLGEVAAADAFIGDLLQPFLDGQAPSTMIVFVADHGEGLGDHGEQTHGIFGYQTTLRVPLVVWGPGVEQGTDDRLARHIDLLPTMLEAVDVAPPADLPGRSLLLPPSDEPTISYFEALSGNLNRGWAPLRGIIRDKIKYIDLPIPELYDLEADPNEQNNLIDEQRRLARELRDLLPAESEWPPQRGTVPPEIEANLRSLGYITDSAPLKESYGPDDDPKRLIALDVKLHTVSRLYDEGRYEDARAEAEELIRLRPEMPQGYSFLAQALLELDRPGEAVAVMRHAVEEGFASDELKQQLGLTLSWAGQPLEAIALLQPMAERNNPATLSALGHAFSEAGRPIEAQEVLERALEIDATDSSVLERLSVVALQLEHWESARGYAQQAVDLDPNLPYSWNNLGVALFYLDRPIEALRAWERSVTLDPNQFDTLYNIGIKGAELGEVDLARNALRSFLERAPRERYGSDMPRARALLQQLGG